MIYQHALLCGVSAAAITAHLDTTPVEPGLPWVTVSDVDLDSTSPGWAGYTERIIIDAAEFTAAGTMARLTFKASSTGLDLGSCYIGYQADDGDSYDFFDTPTQVFFNEGDPDFSIGADATIASDPIDFEYEAGRNLIVSFYIPDGSSADTLASDNSRANYDSAYKNTGATDDAATVDASGYSTGGISDCVSLTKIEFVLSGAAVQQGIRIPPWRVPSALTGFPVAVDLADLPQSFWDGTTEDGGNIRVKTAADASLPCDLVYFDKGAKKGRLFFRSDLSNSATNDFKVVTEAGGTTPAPGSTYGRNAVWQDFEAFFAFSSLEDRTGNGHDATLSGSSSNYDYGVVTTSPDVNAHQGIAFDGTYYYVCDTSTIRKYDLSWNLLLTSGTVHTIASLPAGATHSGDGTIYGGELFLPCEAYPNSPYDNQHIVVLDPADLTFKRKYDISANLHEISSITYDETNGYFVLTDFTSPGYTKLHKYDTDFNYLGVIDIPSTAKMQGIAYYDGFFWISTDGKNLYKMALDGSTREVMWSGTISGYMEGIESVGDGTFLILFDGSPSAVYTFGPSATTGEPGWLNLSGSGQAKTNQVPTFASWSIGASFIPRGIAQGAIVSYSKDTASPARSSLVNRDGDHLGIWNLTDGWYDPGSAEMNLLREYRGHMLHDGTTARKLFYNGLARGTDSPVAQVPPLADVTILFIGAEDASLQERVNGSINYVYLREGILSDDWIAVEGLSWLIPNRLYDVLDHPDANVGDKVALTNPAATTDATGWTSRFGSGPVRTTTRGRSLPAAFAVGDVANPWWDQEVTVPSSQETYIDAGAVMVEVPYWQQGYGSDLDEAGPTLGFYDGSGVLLARRFFPREDISGGIGNWAPRKASCPVPVGTRKVRFGFHGQRFTGTELSAYVDDLGPVEFKPLPGYTADLIYWNLGGDTTGKVDVAGTLATRNNTQIWNATTNNVLYWNTGTTNSESYIPIDVSAHATEIDDEGCRIDAYTFKSSYNALDKGQDYIEFRDGSGTLLGSRQVFYPTQIAYPIAGQGQFLDLAVPAGTRTIRFGKVGTLVDGAALDDYSQWINIFLKKPRS
jgi:hypothetical protein